MSLVERMDGPPQADGRTIDNDADDDIELNALPFEAQPVSKLGADQQFIVLSGWWRTDADHSRDWRNDCSTWFAFRAGEQWTPEDRALLEGQGRPVIVFNRVLTILKAVAGMEINGRHEIAYLPRGTEDTKPNEVLSAASKWMADTCDGEDEESQAFDDTCTCGMGWVEERMSYEDDPSGLYVEEEVDPREMYWDRTARKKNLTGARRMHRVRRMSLGDAMNLFPGKTKEQIDAVWANDWMGEYPLRSIEQRRRRDTDNVLMQPYDDSCEVTVVQTQWIERECYYIVADPITNTSTELTEEQYKKLEARMKVIGIPLHAVKMMRKVYKSAFLGGEGVMLKMASPAPIKGQFSWKCITGEFDAVKGTWFGLVKVLRDPQSWANKWLAQILHILNSTAKGGILAETSAFDDERQAEDSYAQPEAITWVSDGALSGDKPKVMPKPGTPLTEGYVGLLTFAISSFKDVTGINLELLGQQDQNQPGILEMMRKQAGMTVLATLFDSLRRFRKQVARGRLYFIQNFLSDGRLIRVVSPDQVQSIALAKDKTFGEYDVVVDDTPTSPNQKEANWAIIQPLLVVFKEQLMANPAVLAMLLEYSPLPSRIVDAVKKFVAEAANNPEAQQMKEIALAAEMAKIDKDRSVANLNNAKAGGSQADAIYMITTAQNMLADNKRAELEAHLKMMAEAAKARDAEMKALISASEHEVYANAEAAKVGVARADAVTRRITAVANAEEKQRNAGNDRIGLLIEHLAAQSKATRDHAGAVKDMAVARREERTPVQAPGSK